MKTTLALMLVFTLLIIPATAQADNPRTDTAATATTPPPRPLPLTTEQVAALDNLSQLPQLAVAPDTHAAYSPKAAKFVTEASAVGFYAAYFSTLTIVLIAAAPL